MNAIKEEPVTRTRESVRNVVFLSVVPLLTHSKNTKSGTCEIGVTGLACEIECESRCNNRGSCFFTRNDENVFHARCLCEVGYEGEACEEESNCEDDCNGQLCWRGECLCSPGYSGPTCEVETPCSDCKHGKCFDSKCFCEEGWRGDACDIEIECDPVDCNGRGRCVKGSYSLSSCKTSIENEENVTRQTGTCMCDATHVGDKCDIEAEATSCSSRGISIHGECACLPSFTGPECAMFKSSSNDEEELTPSAAMRREGMNVAKSRDGGGVYSLIGGISFVTQDYESS